MKCLLITWCDFCLFNLSSLCLVMLSNSCENEQKSFQLSSISMSVPDLYLICMTLVPRIDKILFSIYDRGLALLLFSLHQMYHISHSLHWNETKALFVCPSHVKGAVKWQLRNPVLASGPKLGLVKLTKGHPHYFFAAPFVQGSAEEINLILPVNQMLFVTA